MDTAAAQLTPAPSPFYGHSTPALFQSSSRTQNIYIFQWQYPLLWQEGGKSWESFIFGKTAILWEISGNEKILILSLLVSFQDNIFFFQSVFSFQFPTPITSFPEIFLHLLAGKVQRSDILSKSSFFHCLTFQNFNSEKLDNGEKKKNCENKNVDFSRMCVEPFVCRAKSTKS